MQLYPAIDLKGGQCVRLRQGMFHDMTTYSDSPERMAIHWARQGASFLHLVDLDGALAGHSVNEEVIRKIVNSVSIKVQIGGGIRSTKAVRSMLDLGVTRVIIGTKAVSQPEFIDELVKEFGSERIVVGVDAKDGMAAMNGWEQISKISALELCLKMKAFGVKHIVYTDISKDGMMAGPNVMHTKQLTEETGMDIIASGGVSCIEDLIRLNEAGIQGVIIGKALYEKKIDLNEAVAKFEPR